MGQERLAVRLLKVSLFTGLVASYGYVLLQGQCASLEIARLSEELEVLSLCQRAQATASTSYELRKALEGLGYEVILYSDRMECTKVLMSGNYIRNPLGVTIGAVVYETGDVVTDYYVYSTRRVF
jgi:hypothetical protein